MTLEVEGEVTALSPDAPDAVRDFLWLSEVLTGYEGVELLSTGMVNDYYDALLEVIGAREAGKLFAAARAVQKDRPAADDGFLQEFRKRILDDDRFGPVARNVIVMWYLGQWVQLPRAWRNSYGATSFDYDRVISAEAYREGLVWPAGGTHPMGAKMPGYGSWASPPLGATP